MLRKSVLVLAVMVSLVLPVAAQASDPTLKSLALKSLAATQSFATASCMGGPTTACMNKVVVFIRLDTKVIQRMTARVQPRGSRCGDAQFKANSKMRRVIAVGRAWVRGSATGSTLANAQITFISAVGDAYQAC